MTRCFVRIITLLALMLAVPAAAGAAATGTPLHITGVDASGYPNIRVGFTGPGESNAVPHLSVVENGVAVDNVNVVPGRIGLVEPSSAPTILLAIDASRSMDGAKLAYARSAAARIVGEAPPRSRIGLLTFGHEARVLVAPTTNHQAVLRAVTALQATTSGTRLYDAVAIGAHALSAVGKDGVLVLVSDGADIGSTTTLPAAVAAATTAHVTVFTVGIAAGHARASLPLARIAAATGGRATTVTDPRQLGHVYDQLSSTILHPWWLEYRTTLPRATRASVVITAGGMRAGTLIALPGAATVAQVPQRAPRVASTPRPAIELPDATWAAALAVMPLVLALMVAGVHLRRVRRQHRLQRRIGSTGAAAPDVVPRTDVRPSLSARAGAAVHAVAGSSRPLRRLARDLEHAGVAMREGELAALMVLLAIAGLVTPVVAGAPVAGILVAPLAGGAPYAWLRLRLRRCRTAFDRELPSALTAISSGLRAGHSFQQALRSVAHDHAGPVGNEFERVLSEARYGRPLPEALDASARRIDSRDYDFVVTTVHVQRQAGGSMAEIFDMVAETVRSRQLLRRKVRALTSQGRLSAYVLVALPGFLLVALTALNHQFMNPLLGTTAGHALLAIASVSVLVGGLLINRVVSIRP